MRASVLAVLASGFLLLPARAANVTYEVFRFPGSSFTEALGLNLLGQVVGDYSLDPEGANPHGYLKQGSTYQTIDVPGALGTIPSAINNSGIVAGYFEDAGGLTHGFLSSGAAFTTLDVPGSIATFASGINASGQVAGYYEDAAGITHGFLRSPGGLYSTIDVPDAAYSAVEGINDLGQMVGAFIDGGGTMHGFLLDGGVFRQLDVDGAQLTNAYGINNAGAISGTWFSSGDQNDLSSAFLLVNGAYDSFRAPGTVTTALGNINGLGQFAGALCFTPALDNYGFVASPVPEPSTLALAAMGLLLAFLRAFAKPLRKARFIQ